MKHTKLGYVLAAGLAVMTSAALAGGVASITEDGTSASGKTMYKVTCSSGSEYRIYYADGEWYEGGMGALGGQSRNLEEQAAVVCN